MTAVLIVVALLAGVLPDSQSAQRAAPEGLRIVVISGEDQVNVIQQKTAVAPVVEVRDRNNLPVAGVTVTFSVAQGATFGGASTITVVTNAAGQAVAAGLTPTAAGAISIQATAVSEGLKAVATIAQRADRGASGGHCRNCSWRRRNDGSGGRRRCVRDDTRRCWRSRRGRRWCLRPAERRRSSARRCGAARAGTGVEIS